MLAHVGWSKDYADLTLDEKFYRVSALYMSLMSQGRRKRLAAFFTPPHVGNALIERLEVHGLNSAKARILDPACGGAAFLVPLCQRAARSGAPNSQILENIRGIEIEPGLTALSRAFVKASLRETHVPEQQLNDMVMRGNALANSFGEYDAVVSNPPYGRVYRPSSRILAYGEPVIADKYVNTYALFCLLALRALRPGGLAGLIIPTSFLSGPNFKRLRSYLRAHADVLELVMIEKRSELFLDVTQDTCMLLLRKKRIEDPPTVVPACGVLHPTGVEFFDEPLGLPRTGDEEWVLPSTRPESSLDLLGGEFHTLRDYGYEVRSGYFVWNREKDSLRDGTTASQGEFPLVWAANIRPGRIIEPTARSNSNFISLARVGVSSRSVHRKPALVLQRTNNRKQKKRLVVSLVAAEVIERFGGFVTENHTIAIVPSSGQPILTPEQVLTLLNTDYVDNQFRRIAGAVSISAKLLRRFPLPDPLKYLSALEEGRTPEQAAREAYTPKSTLGERDYAISESAFVESGRQRDLWRD